MSLPESRVAASPRSRFEGRTAIVTGSGRGIGFQVARILLSEGASVVINDVNSERLAGASQSLGLVDDRLAPIVGSVTDSQAVEKLISTAVTRFGRLDILVNMVGGSYGAPHMRLMEFDIHDWYHILDLNL